MNKLDLLAGISIAICGAGLDAKGTTGSNHAPLIGATIDGTPLRINIGDDHSFQVYNSTIGSAIGQIYPANEQLGDMGWFVRVGNSLTAPSFSEHAVTATSNIGLYAPYGNRSATAVSGSGAVASPYSVTVQGTTAGMTATQTITYVNGENLLQKSFELANSGLTPISARIFVASNIYLANSDSGKPFFELISGSPGGRSCAGITPTYTIA